MDMNENKQAELTKAISKLSEDDQLQISGGQQITKSQCNELNKYTNLVAYGGPLPKFDTIPITYPKKDEEINQAEEKTDL